MCRTTLLAFAITLCTTSCAFADANTISSARAMPDSDAITLCPDSPNCVSSMAAEKDSHRIPPLIGDEPGIIAERIVDAVASIPRCSIVTRTPQRIHAICRSRLFGFEDDLYIEARKDTPVVDIRSSARSGWWDMGVNRRRVEEVRKRIDNFRR